MSKSKRLEGGGAMTAPQHPDYVREQREEPRSDVQVTPNGDAVYVPRADAQTETAPRPEKQAETKRERFKRLLGRRLPKVVKAIEQLIPLAGKAQYESSDAQREFLLARLNEAVLKVQSAFSNTAAPIANMVIPD